MFFTISVSTEFSAGESAKTEFMRKIANDVFNKENKEDYGRLDNVLATIQHSQKESE